MITEVIPKGKENAVTARECSVLTGNPIRSIMAEISKARLDGAAIASDNTGFFQTDNPEDLLRSAKRFKARAKAMFAVGKALEKAAKLMKGETKHGK